MCDAVLLLFMACVTCFSYPTVPYVGPNGLLYPATSTLCHHHPAGAPPSHLSATPVLNTSPPAVMSSPYMNGMQLIHVKPEPSAEVDIGECDSVWTLISV